ncbi:MAG: beta-ribofuranosylaminobenzene 5'-phosphate synthase family protein [Halobacteriaceae archaeon]
MTVRVSCGARLHFGFCNLSLAHERLYGSLGVGVEEPRVTVTADPADRVRCTHPDARAFAETAVEILDVPGAAVAVESELPRHAGLGSGTQLALAVLSAVARANDVPANPVENAPALGRGGRSGVGLATFRRGGFVLDAGHPTGRFTTKRPSRGNWDVPAPVASHDVPDDWRFVLVTPETDAGPSDETEDRKMRAVVESASPDVADRVSGVVLRRVLPAVVEGDHERFGAGVAEVGRLNGAWYADEQGGVYRPPVGELVASLSESPAVAGAGQSSWGPTAYAVTDVERVDAAERAARDALGAAGVDGTVRVVAGRNRGRVVTGP